MKHARTALLGLSIAILWTGVVVVSVHAGSRHLDGTRQHVAK